MWRLFYVIARNIFRLPVLIGTMRRMIKETEKYTQEDRYNYIQYIVELIHSTGYIHTEVYGEENLPEEGGYMMYPNHQGKYDAYGLIGAHKKPCTVVMDIEKSNIIFVKEALDMLKGKRLDKKDNRQALRIINELAEEMKQGNRCVLFPEGGYENDKKNTLGEFKAGCFKIVLKSKVPIVPVVLIDSYKVFNSWQLTPVTTQVHYLTPILYEEYKGLKTDQIAAMVKERIQQKIDEVTCDGNGVYE